MFELLLRLDNKHSLQVCLTFVYTDPSVLVEGISLGSAAAAAAQDKKKQETRNLRWPPSPARLHPQRVTLDFWVTGRLRRVRRDGSRRGGLAEGEKKPHTWRIRTGSAWTSGPRVDTAGRNLMAGCQISPSFLTKAACWSCCSKTE